MVQAITVLTVLKMLTNGKYLFTLFKQSLLRQVHSVFHGEFSRAAFLNGRAAARYRALASIITRRERFYWNLSF